MNLTNPNHLNITLPSLTSQKRERGHCEAPAPEVCKERCCEASYRYTLAIHPRNASRQYSLSMHPLNASFQCILSIHLINTHLQSTLSMYSVHPLTNVPSHTSYHPPPPPTLLLLLLQVPKAAIGNEGTPTTQQTVGNNGISIINITTRYIY